MRPLLIAVVLLASVAAHAQPINNLCEAVASDAEQMANRRDIGLGPQPGALDALRRWPKLYESEAQMTRDIYSTNISPRLASSLAYRACGWVPLSQVRASAPGSDVDPERGWNHADRGAPGHIPCEQMAHDGQGQLAPGFLAACRKANAEQRRPGF